MEMHLKTLINRFIWFYLLIFMINHEFLQGLTGFCQNPCLVNAGNSLVLNIENDRGHGSGTMQDSSLISNIVG